MMREDYFYTEGLTVGYQGVPLIREIAFQLKKEIGRASCRERV